MKIYTIIALLLFAVELNAQETGDTTYSRCPIAITDTSGYNNYFTSHQSAVVKVEKIKGNITITIQQREQYYTIFFNGKKLSAKTYKIKTNADDKSEVYARYSFRSAGRASYVETTSGTMEVSYNKETKLWNLKVNGILSNLVERNVAFYKVKADFSIK
jgi:hypothetical protein